MCPNCMHLFPFPRGGHGTIPGEGLENPCEEPGGLLSLGWQRVFPFLYILNTAIFSFLIL